ncbi:MAG TPA: FAD-dependent oxidoreductase [Thermoleophilaceae bacterium]|nr:FAD-dependent oxidoreductase [Thermoleophilaceae bacterium]
MTDVAVVGGGIVGCAAAAFLAEAGARVELFERDELAGAASGRNSGVLQHPFDPVLAELHPETLRHLAELDGFELPAEPAGVLMLATEPGPLDETAGAIARDQPELQPLLLDPAGVRELEPAVGEELWGCRLETGYPVRPEAATLALAESARRAGATLHEGRKARLWLVDGELRGVLADGEQHAAGAVLVCAGPWTAQVVDPTGSWRPIVPVWGVVLDVAMGDPPRHVVEQVGVEEVAAGSRLARGSGPARTGATGSAPPGSIFSLVASEGAISVGSTFLTEEPDPVAWIPELYRRGQRFVPALARARVESARACARPVSLDGRPLLGPLETEGLWVAAGHGPWGISTGAATGRLAADIVLGRAEAPAALRASRFF